MRLLDLFVTLATWKCYRRKLKKNLPPKKNLKSSFSLPLFGEAGGKGDSVFALPPAEPVNEIGSDIFKYIPPIGKSSFWLARYAGSPADFKRKLEFFVFVPRSRTPEAGFSKLKL